MFSWLPKRPHSNLNDHHLSPTNRKLLADHLQRMYKEKLAPLEQYTSFHHFHSFRIEDSDFSAKPMILLIGQYSTGKTTFIRSIIEQDYPGMRIGPEPTTDNFTIISDGPTESIIPGNALVSDKSLPYGQLAKFGNAFLNRLQMSTVPSPVLENVVFIDTPGVAAGMKHHKVQRGYDFTEVIAWFASHADRVILFFDACKLDISDEFKKVIEIVRDNDEKIRVVFNKADLLTEQELMRSYGAIMWFLGRALPFPEPSRLYVSSFWSGEMRSVENRALLESEAQDLYQDLQALPRSSALRKINDLAKRARLVKVHAYLMAELYNRLPASSVIGRKLNDFLGNNVLKKTRENLANSLPEIYEKLERKLDLSFGDFPILNVFKERLLACDFETKLVPLRQSLIDEVDNMLNSHSNPLMSAIFDFFSLKNTEVSRGGTLKSVISAGANSPSPFEEQNADLPWAIDLSRRAKYNETFVKIKSEDGKVSGASVREELLKTKLPNSVLAKIWRLSDMDNDNCLDEEEFAVAMYLAEMKLKGHDLPNFSALPIHLVPPSKRHLFEF
ncbi:hypothetical protein HELRODRAFT_91367 [Helobdella robusta]|uniref:Uncharacterized protein n=1 Tax=Helobdella robusta TaxID=6412 RepID=T1G830_HELRO|nr:hypothetical protein HELRODRAFT_91367 [Helobdella robusta]ESN89840.1 hypothetical protein HELRODRAFT_91367 [Helobdella robusta]